MFYGIIQRGLDKWNASFFCGSAAVLRREALETTDGFSGISITEDCETALELHSRGWNSVYVDKPLIAGLQPETFASFIGQRSRWAQGMMQILRFRFPPLKRGLTIAAAPLLHVEHAVLAVPVPRMIFLIAPLFYLFFDLEIFIASGGEFVAYTLDLHDREPDDAELPLRPLPLAVDLRALRIRPVGLPPAGGRLGDAQPAQADLQGHGQGRDARPRAASRSSACRSSSSSRVLARSASASPSGRSSPSPIKADVTLVVGGWNLLNLIMAGCALGVVSERRRAPESPHRGRALVPVAGRRQGHAGGHRERLGAAVSASGRWRRRIR